MEWRFDIRGNIAQKSRGDAAALATLQAALKSSQAAMSRYSVATAQAIASKDAKGFAKYNKAVEDTAEQIRILREAEKRASVGLAQKSGGNFFATLAKSGGPIGRLIGGLSRDFGAFGEAVRQNKLAAYTVAATAAMAATIALASALGSAALDAGSAAASFANAARSTRLLNENAAGGAAGGRELAAVVRQLRNDTDASVETLSAYARELRVARFSGREMQVSVSAAAIATTALGDAAGSAVKSIATQSKEMRRFTLGGLDAYRQFAALKGTGLVNADVIGALAGQLKISTQEASRRLTASRVTVEQGMAAIDAALRMKFGKNAAAQALALDVQFRRLKEDGAALFAGVDIEPFLVSLKDVLSILDQSTYTGYALKTVVGGAFSYMFAQAAKVMPYIKAGFYGLAIGALYTYIALKPTIESFRSLFGMSTEGLTLQRVVSGVATAVQYTTGAILAASAAGLLFAAPIILGVSAVVVAFTALWRAGQRIFAGESWATVGKDLVLGIVRGVLSAGSFLYDAIKGLATGAKNVFTTENKIRSPSRVYEQFGEHITGGVAKGVTGAAPRAESAVSSMSAGMARAAGSAGGGSGRGASVTITGPIYLGGADLTTQLRPLVEQIMTWMLTSALESGPANASA